MKIWLLLIPFTLLQSTFPSEEEKIAWDENRKLRWEDFKGVPNAADDFVASTNSGVSFSVSYREENGEAFLQYTVTANFYPKLSWYRSKDVSKYILAHEQTHFDITELHARKLRKALAEIPQDRSFRDKASILYNKMEAERREMQLQYDADSNHSNIEAEEYRWQDYVKDQLKSFSAWK